MPLSLRSYNCFLNLFSICAADGFEGSPSVYLFTAVNPTIYGTAANHGSLLFENVLIAIDYKVV